MRPRAVVGAVLAIALVAVSASSATAPATATGYGASAARLRDAGPCPDGPGFTCAKLRVPLDRSGRVPGSLDLRVAVSDDEDAPRGVLLFLTGGPGQPGVSLLPRVRRYLDPRVLDEYRLVVFDQRGTGEDAIDCAGLQEAVGGSDHVAPPAAAATACARRLGETRGFYRTTDTVADIDRLREALGVRRLSLDGLSYGTFTGGHYALTHPDRVYRLVLDSVVPHVGYDPFLTDVMRATARVLRAACREDPRCATDPATDLAWLVRHGRIDGRPVDGPSLLESLAILSLSSADPTFRGIPRLLHAARLGDTAALGRLLDRATARRTPAAELSASGLHIATTCADQRFPWGDASAPVAGRARAVARAAARLTRADVWPYDVATATGTLPIAGCTVWPPSTPSRARPHDVLRVRTLLVHGDRDLFCPVEWARREARWAPHGRLVVVPGAGHGVQGRAGPGREAVTAFLLS